MREGGGRYIKSRNVLFSHIIKDVGEAENFPRYTQMYAHYLEWFVANVFKHGILKFSHQSKYCFGSHASE